MLSRHRTVCVQEEHKHKAIRKHSQRQIPNAKASMGYLHITQPWALGYSPCFPLSWSYKWSSTAEDTTTFVQQIQEFRASSEILFALGAKALFALVLYSRPWGQNAQGRATSEPSGVCAEPERSQQCRTALQGSLAQRVNRIWPSGQHFRNI